RALADEGIAWVEEPTLQKVLAGHADEIRRASAILVQMSENWCEPVDMQRTAVPWVAGGLLGWAGLHFARAPREVRGRTTEEATCLAVRHAWEKSHRRARWLGWASLRASTSRSSRTQGALLRGCPPPRAAPLAPPLCRCAERPAPASHLHPGT